VTDEMTMLGPYVRFALVLHLAMWHTPAVHGQMTSHAAKQCSTVGLDTSTRTLKTLADDIAAEINRLRQERKLPRLKLLHTSDMHEFCLRAGPQNEVGVHCMGSNPITGTSTVWVFDAISPLQASSQLKKVVEGDFYHGKNGKLAIDDAHRIAVEVCPLTNPYRYRVVVGYWYSRLGFILDSLQRGNE